MWPCCLALDIIRLAKCIPAAFSGLDDNKVREQANTLAFDFLEYLEQVDYSKYFENMKTAELSGSDRARYSEFSLNCVKTARVGPQHSLRISLMCCMRELQTPKLMVLQPSAREFGREKPLPVAQMKLKSFLALMPTEDLEAAKNQAKANIFG